MNYQKVKHHYHYGDKYRGAAQSIYNLKFIVPNGIPVVFHNVSTYGYPFIIKNKRVILRGNLNVLAKIQKGIFFFSFQ